MATAQLSPKMSKFSRDIFHRTYAFHPNETWDECAWRVANAIGMDDNQRMKFFHIIQDRIFIPGGRYLFSAGRELQQISNCFGFLAGDSREGWAALLHDATMCLSMGGGIGVNYSDLRPSGSTISRMGGKSSGPLALMQMINEVARHVMAGGARRSALWAGLHWKHPDIEEFIKIKDWNDDVQNMKAKHFEAPAPLDMTNISVIIDDEYLQKLGYDPSTQDLHRRICESMARTGEPAFRNQSRILLDDPTGITGNPCIPAHSKFFTKHGITQLADLRQGDLVWTGHQWATISKVWSTGKKPIYRYTLSNGFFLECTDDHPVVDHKIKTVAKHAKTMTLGLGDASHTGHTHTYPILAGLVQGDGTTTHGGGNCRTCLLNIGHKDEEIVNYVFSIGMIRNIVEYEHKDVGNTTIANLNISPEDLHIQRKGIKNRTIEEFWFRANPDTQRQFLKGLFSANGNALAKNGPRVSLKTSNKILAQQTELLLANLGISSYITTNNETEITWTNGTYTTHESYTVNCAGSHAFHFMETIGFIQKYKMQAKERWRTPKYTRKHYPKVVKTEYLGEFPVFDFTVDAPEHTASVNGIIISNCQESTLGNRSCCNLGSIVLPRIQNLSHLEEITRLATQFLINGSIKAHYPTPEIAAQAHAERRIGLGIMGLHEWMLLHGHRYEWSDELKDWLSTWQEANIDEAIRYASVMKCNIPVVKQAIAPTGTISIIAETTSGIEPIFRTAYRRRYLNGDKHYFQYVVDPTAKRLIDMGMKSELIEDSYTLSMDMPRRLDVQANITRYLDQAISSTVNIPTYGTDGNNNINETIQTLNTYLPQLKGITFYPNGARNGQPLVPTELEEALKQEGVVYEEEGERCANGVCGL
mgnify:CR=1 FL=1